MFLVLIAVPVCLRAGMTVFLFSVYTFSYGEVSNKRVLPQFSHRSAQLTVSQKKTMKWKMIELAVLRQASDPASSSTETRNPPMGIPVFSHRISTFLKPRHKYHFLGLVDEWESFNSLTHKRECITHRVPTPWWFGEWLKQLSNISPSDADKA